ncbi:MAG: ABC transporter ATP-binding protein [Anaerolineae bacterium]
MPIIQVERVSKVFALQKDKPRSFQEATLHIIKPKHKRHIIESFWALQDVSFTVERGEMLGVIGANGSGKSTLLKLLTHIIEPTSGTIAVQGRVSALLELGAGFHPELTGRENIYLYGSVLGLKRKEMASRLPEIIHFAELERFIDVPVKFYSSGMYVRLAFAVATSVQPDVLLVDEVLAVGDRSFQEKCLERIAEMRQKGITILLISHDLDTIRRMCSRVIWLSEGIVQADGAAELVTTKYLAHVHEYDEAQAQAAHFLQHTMLQEGTTVIRMPQKDTPASGNDGTSNPLKDTLSPFSNRWGSLEAEITDVTLLDEQGNERLQLLTGEPVTIVVHYNAHRRIEQPTFGIAIFRIDGTHMCGSNTSLAGLQIEAIEGAGQVAYRIESLPLLEGSYSITAAIHDESESQVYDYQQCYYPFKVHLGNVKERYGLLYISGSKWSHQAVERDIEVSNQNASQVT